MADYFRNNVLLPAMFERIDRLFPEMGFIRKGEKWLSSKGMGGRETRTNRPDKTVVTNTPQRGVCILEQGGESMGIINYYMEQNNIHNYWDAVQQICSIIGIECPKGGDNAEYTAWREKQTALERLMREMQRALFTPDGETTLKYLREHRGYTDAEIGEMGMGYCSKASADKFRTLLANVGTNVQYNVGNTHTLAIPYLSGTEIRGIVFRAVDDAIAPKYTEAFISKKDTKAYHLWGLTGKRLTGRGKNDRDIIVVEGEIDALRATVKGVPNVVAATGTNLPAEALKEAKDMGVERIILLLDYDGEDKIAGREKNIQKAIGTIRAIGITPLVAEFPHDGAKVDADLYLKTHTGAELTELAYSATDGVVWQLQCILRKYPQKMEAQQFDRLRREIVDLAFGSNLAQWEKDILFTAVEQCTDNSITRTSLREELEKINKASKENERTAAAKRLLSDMQDSLSGGDFAALQSKLAEGAKLFNNADKESAWERVLQPQSEDAIFAALREKQSGIPSGIHFGKYGDDGTIKGSTQEWLIPTGALTIIAAPTSHGKSRFLQNMAINLMRKEDRDGDIIYISLEEDSASVIERLINIYLDRFICYNNSRAIRSYFSNGDNYAKGGDIEPLQNAAEELINGYISRGKLRILSRAELPTISSIEELVCGIEKATKMGTVQAVFIDYMQLITTQAKLFSKKEELAYICDKLMECSTTTKLPIILAAQLNREASSPVDMDAQNIADASNIEHSANSIILLWDSVQKPAVKKQSNNYDAGGKDKLENMGITLGIGGKLYALLAKCRGMERNIEAVLDYNGNTFKVYPNSPKETTEKQERGISLDKIAGK